MRFQALRICCVFMFAMVAGITAAQACDHPAAETKAPAAQGSQKPAPQPDLAAEATRLLRETAAALQNRTIEPAEERSFLALIATAEQLKSAQFKAGQGLAPSERDRLRALARVRLRQAAEVLAKQAARKPAPGKGPATIQTPPSTTLAQQLPGLGAGNGALGFGNAAERESAQQLMDVITGSIQPESWEDYGGTGVIRYFALGHALVITATSDVHNNVGDLIEQLR